MKPLPLGIQTFSEIHRLGMLYVDKTEQIHRLVTQGKHYFLSRPRRFGKSLLLSTIRELFLGSRQMFEGLWIHDRWDWTSTHPVIHIGMASLGYDAWGLSRALQLELQKQAERFGLGLAENSEDQMFRELLEKVHASRGRVVLLIDEYDKPIIDYLGLDAEKAIENRAIFKRFYSVLKDADPHLQFLLITGVSKFSKVSIFSDLNNLTDLTMSSQAASLVGITDEEIRQYFPPYLDRIAARDDFSPEQLQGLIKEWYNGYSWDGTQTVYNPFSLLSFFREGQFRNFWFETGTPSFLLQLMKEQNLFRFDEVFANEASLSAFGPDHIRLIPLLFQTGYLTIKRKDPARFLLGYPNREVQQSMQQYILGELMHTDPGFTTNPVVEFREALEEKDLSSAFEVLQGIFSRIPYDLFIANQEAYYHSLLHVFFEFMGHYFASEVRTSKGRIDAVVQTERDVWLFEFKLDQPAATAMQQIRERRYFEAFLGTGKTIHLLGVAFSSQQKGISEWMEEIVEG